MANFDGSGGLQKGRSPTAKAPMPFEDFEHLVRQENRDKDEASCFKIVLRTLMPSSPSFTRVQLKYYYQSAD